MNDIIKSIEEAQLKSDITPFLTITAGAKYHSYIS